MACNWQRTVCAKRLQSSSTNMMYSNMSLTAPTCFHERAFEIIVPADERQVKSHIFPFILYAK